MLSAALPAGTRVLASAVEHHSNLLPWRRHDLRLLAFPRSPDELLDACERALRAGAGRPGRGDGRFERHRGGVAGRRSWPRSRMRYGARLFVDAAQLAPHRPVDMAAAGIDFLALSGHKLYAPFGAGALIGALAGG